MPHTRLLQIITQEKEKKRGSPFFRFHRTFSLHHRHRGQRDRGTVASKLPKEDYNVGHIKAIPTEAVGYDSTSISTILCITVHFVPDSFYQRVTRESVTTSHSTAQLQSRSNEICSTHTHTLLLVGMVSKDCLHYLVSTTRRIFLFSNETNQQSRRETDEPALSVHPHVPNGRWPCPRNPIW